MDTFDIISCVFSLLFILLGIIVHYGKSYNLIAGYNTLSKEQKKTITKDQLTKITRMLRNLFFGMGFSLLIGMFVFHYFNIYQYFPHYFGITVSVWCIVACIFAFHKPKG